MRPTLSEVRKAANVMAKALRLGRARGATEVERGICTRCGLGTRAGTAEAVDGIRRFQTIHHYADENRPAVRYIQRGRGKLCVLCLINAGSVKRVDL